MKKKALVALIVLVALAAGVGAYRNFRNGKVEPQITTALVTRGPIVDSVGATGTLEAVTTVQVGTQVSGTILSLNADFNSIVRKGQVIAKLDPSLFDTQIEQARANLVRAEADVERLRVGLDDSRTKLQRAEELSGRQLIPRSELETAQVNVRAAEAQLRSSQAQVTQARASLNQNQVNLQHTVIESPIDGIVISRNVDIGQTVAASMQAPTLFVLAADLTKMKVNASVDEADVGRIRPAQRVRFRVDAFPLDEFIGTVSQIRLQPITVQNVVTYATVIDVPNPDLKLKPGMTANVTIEIARQDDAVRIPNAALRFRPTPEIFAAFNQDPAAEMPRAGRPDRASRPTPAGTAGTGAERPVAMSSGQTGDQEPQDERTGARRGQGGGPGRGDGQGFRDPERRRQMLERLQSLPPEERERMRQRMRERGIDPDAVSKEGNAATPAPPATPPAATAPATAAGRGGQRPPAPSESRKSGATTIDSLFGPLPATETVGRVWLFVGGKLKPARLRLGISDGANTELLSDEVKPDTTLVTAVSLGTETAGRAAAPTGRSPLMGGGGRGGPPGGGVRNPAPGR